MGAIPFTQKAITGLSIRDSDSRAEETFTSFRSIAQNAPQAFCGIGIFVWNVHILWMFFQSDDIYVHNVHISPLLCDTYLTSLFCPSLHPPQSVFCNYVYNICHKVRNLNN